MAALILSVDRGPQKHYLCASSKQILPGEKVCNKKKKKETNDLKIAMMILLHAATAYVGSLPMNIHIF
jgi:hypothetical protein